MTYIIKVYNSKKKLRDERLSNIFNRESHVEYLYLSESYQLTNNISKSVKFISKEEASMRAKFLHKIYEKKLFIVSKLK